MKNHQFYLLSCLIYFCGQFTIQAQEIKTANFSSDAWEIKAKKHEFVEYKGKQSLSITAGKARLKNSTFKNGIIDYDIALHEGVNFSGVHFRVNGDNYEEFYLRSHQSGNPDATQYTPVINGNSGWQLYHGKGHSSAYNFNFKEWMHIRLVIDDGKMDVFINDMSQPFLHVPDLKLSPAAGQIGLSNGSGKAYFANLTYQAIEHPTLLSKTTSVPTPAKEVISSWQVSSPFTDSLLKSVHQLDEFPLYKNTNWQKLSTEYTGTINLSRITPVSRFNNTILVKAIIRSDKNQLKRLDFGYSDVATLFVNKQAIYTGHNRFRSRDYRYLGTIGYFDGVFLPLKKGDNEIIFAVTENFGGWGMKAKLADLDGIVVQ